MIREAREAAGLTPPQLAAAVHRTASYVSRLETDGVKTPPPDVVANVARTLALDEEELVRRIGYLSTVRRDASDRRPVREAPPLEIAQVWDALSARDRTSVLGFARYLLSTGADGGAEHGHERERA